MRADHVAVGALGGGADDGPRSAAVGAPQRIGGAPKPPLCEVRRMWPEALFDLAGEARRRRHQQT